MKVKIYNGILYGVGILQKLCTIHFVRLILLLKFKIKNMKIEMNLICPKCKSFLKFGNGYDPDPQNCTEPNEFCTNKDCDFVIFYEQKEPEDIQDFMEKHGLGDEDMINDITLSTEL